MSDTPVQLPDGTTGVVPTARAAVQIVQDGGRVLTPEQHEEAQAAANQAKIEHASDSIAKDAAETWAAGQHAAIKGVGEAFGVPVDQYAVGAAKALGVGDPVQKALHGLETKHPYASGYMGVVGNIAGAAGAAELTGRPGANMPGMAGVGARMAVGGVENVVQATTHDFNESALGAPDENAEKIVADMPRHFYAGAILSGAFEGGAYGIGRGISAFSKRATPALDAAASRSLGRELGLEGAEAEAAGARVRGLTEGGAIPKTRESLADVLSREQAAQRGVKATKYGVETADYEAAQLGARERLARDHTSELGDFESQAGQLRKQVDAQGASSLEAAEGEAVDEGFRGLAKRGELEDAARARTAPKQLEAESKLADAKTGMRRAEEPGRVDTRNVDPDELEMSRGQRRVSLEDIEEQPVWEPEKMRALEANPEAANKPVRLVMNDEGTKWIIEDGIHRIQLAKQRGLGDIEAITTEYVPRSRATELGHLKLATELAESEHGALVSHYEKAMGELKVEYTEAYKATEAIRMMRAEMDNDVLALEKKLGPSYESMRASMKAQREELKAHIGGQWATKSGGGVAVGKQGYAMRAAEHEALMEAASETGNPALMKEAERLTELREQLATAHEQASKHLADITSAAKGTEATGAKEIAGSRSKLEQMAAFFETQRTAKVAAAQKVLAAAQKRIAIVEAETAKHVTAAEGKGANAVAQAEARGQARIAAAKADHEAAKVAVEKTIRDEAAKTVKGHEAQRAELEAAQGKIMKGRKGPDETTDVDPLVKGLAKKSAEPASPTVSPGAALSAAFSIMHGHPMGAAGIVGASFAAGAARNAGNLAAARAMRDVSRRITAVDNAVRDGVSRMLGITTTTQAVAGSRPEPEKPVREPKFDEVRASLLATQANPDLLERRVRVSLGHLSKDAPQTYLQTIAHVRRANTYLMGLLPQGTRDPYTLTPQLQPDPVNATDQYEFMQAVRVIDDPLSILEATRGETLNAMQVDAISNVSPQLYQQIRDEVRYQAMSLDRPLSYERNTHVGTLLGIVTDTVLEPDFQTTLSNAYAEKEKKNAPVGQGSKAAGDSGGSKLAKGLTSGSQAVEGGTP